MLTNKAAEKKTITVQIRKIEKQQDKTASKLKLTMKWDDRIDISTTISGPSSQMRVVHLHLVTAGKPRREISHRVRDEFRFLHKIVDDMHRSVAFGASSSVVSFHHELSTTHNVPSLPGMNSDLYTSNL